jgi:hypothetical protein
MSQPVTIFDNALPIQLRLTADVATALGLADADVAVVSIKTQGGVVLVDHQAGQTLTRYLLPPSAIRYARQAIQQGPPPPPPQS